MRLKDQFRAVAYLPETTGLFQTYYQQTYGTPFTENVLSTFQSYASQAYGGNAVVFGLIDVRAKLLSEATFKFQDLTTKKLYGNTDLLLLEEPWPNGTTGELIIRMEQDGSLAGNAFIRKDPDRLVRLRPDWVSIVLNTFGDPDRSRWDVTGYVYHPNIIGGDVKSGEFYTVDEVAHWSPIPDPLAQYRGMSWLQPVVKEINADMAMTDYKRRFMDNSATPNLLVKYTQQLTEDALKKVRETWNARYGGTDGLKTAVLDNGADVQVIGSPLQALDFANVQAAGENRIAVAAGVPSIVAGLSEGLDASTYSNYQQAMRRFADLTGRPLWRSLCACLAPLVTVPDGSKLWYDTADIAALREGEQERATTLQTLAGAANAWITAGYVPESVTKALESGDLGQLVHSGRVSVQLYDPSQVPDQTAKAQPDGPAIAKMKEPA